MGYLNLRKDLLVELDMHDMFKIAKVLVFEQTEMLKRLMELNDKQEIIRKCNCPFPAECKEFPCKTLSCNADVCDNGYAYRMS